MNAAPLSWIQNIQQTAIDAAAIPLSGFIPVFAWDDFSSQLSDILEHTPLLVQMKRVQPIVPDDLLKGLGAKPVILSFNLVPLAGQCSLLMPKEEVDALCTSLLTTSSSYKGFSSQALQEGFFYYLCTQAASLFNEMQCFPSLTVQLSNPSPPPQEESLCIDLEITTAKRSFFARLLIPATVHAAIKTLFAKKMASAADHPLLKSIPLTTFLTIGETTLLPQDIQNMRPGDVLLLNRCLWDPQTKKGTAQLLLQQTPLFRVRFKEDHLKILNYAIPEDVSPMTSSEFDPEEEKEFAEIDQETKQEAPADSSDEGLISTQQIPITLVVEVARLKLTLDELLNLSPGNTLELSARPEQGVFLTIQGKRVATAELIKMGDLLGVRILTLGKM